MSKLREVFETIISQLHWGPSHRPFLEAVIVEHDDLQERVDQLESDLKEVSLYVNKLMNPSWGESVEDHAQISEPVKESALVDDLVVTTIGEFDSLKIYPSIYPSHPTYETPENKFEEPTPEHQSDPAPDAPIEAVTNPAEPVQTPPDLLAQPEPVPAGPDATVVTTAE